MSAEGLRKAAVELAALHPQDRTWLLERLRPSWRYDLRRLLAQVGAMGRFDAATVQAAVRARSAIEPSQPPAPDRLLAGMRGLSPAWCARVLAACAPDHMEVFAANTTRELANSVRAELLTLPRLPRKLSEALAQAVRERGERAVSSGRGDSH